MSHVYRIPFGAKDAVVEIGHVARQANGACTVRVGDTVALVAAVMAPEPSPSAGFFPLMVDYREKFYSSGRIPGGFFKREGRPSDQETLRARLIDRTIRPLFPEHFFNEVQVYVTILSYDNENLPELPAMLGASVALHISNIPLLRPIAGVRVALGADGQFLLNPTLLEKEASDLDLVVAGHAEAINMVECGANEIPEERLIEALEFGHAAIQRIVDAVEGIRAEIGVPKIDVPPPPRDEALAARVAELAQPHWPAIYEETGKSEKNDKLKAVLKSIQDALGEDFAERATEVQEYFEALYEQKMRRRVLDEGLRADMRGPTDIRPLSSQVSFLPRTHGSALFTRGQTQALATVTLGSVSDQQMIDDIFGISYKDFMLHYNFPAYSVGECRPPRGPGRREIGHGMLAERALRPVLPTQEQFPYTIRLVSEVLESNGSSSMATVCAGCLALMDAGVPLRTFVGGVAMGLIKEGEQVAILTDILGAEDHYGDMDFKVAGTEQGVTALQMDIKVTGVSREILQRALAQARDARLAIIAHMKQTIAGPRADLSPWAPRIEVIMIDPSKIREVIGSGGKVINAIVEKTGAKIDITDDGKVYICSPDKEGVKMARSIIEAITKELKVGEVYEGRVTRTASFGAIVEVAPGKDGMLHISELAHHRVAQTEDVVKEGDIVTVKVIEVDKEAGRVRFSRKALLPPPQDSGEGGGRGERRDHGERGERGGHRRGGHRRDGEGGGHRERGESDGQGHKGSHDRRTHHGGRENQTRRRHAGPGDEELS
ncbi:MAG: polyribonucleotide nucleotidyltransferase [Candidatus Sumerlaeia bacterium]